MKSNGALNSKERQSFIVQVFTNCFGEMIQADPEAWRSKFRKMSATPFAFYRGSAALFFTDVAAENDPAFLNEQTSRVWIHGDLHAENFGTYLNSEGILVFDVNDFDEAFVGPFMWDLKRLAASLTLIGYQKALSDEEIQQIISQLMGSYAKQVTVFIEGEDSSDFALTLDNTSGKLKEVLLEARLRSRLGMLDNFTEIKNYDRSFRLGKYNFAINKRTRRKVESAFRRYLKTIPQRKLQANMNYHIKDVVETRGVGIGSAGYEIYTLLLEGPNQALENDIVISMKQGQTPSASRVVTDEALHQYFKHNGHRTVLSQRALQAYSDPWLGYTDLNGEGRVVAEISPYNADLEWEDINIMSDILELVAFLGQAVAKIHCVSDEDSDQTLVPFSTDEAIHSVLKGQEDNFVQHLMEFGQRYGAQVREDYYLFVDAFRNHQFPGL